MNNQDKKLEPGELVMYVGTTAYTPSFENRVIYQVIEVSETTPSSTEDKPCYVYKLRAVFDIKNPIGNTVDTLTWRSSSVGNFKRLTLLDVGIIRLKFDSFIKEWVKSLGTDVSHMPTASDVLSNE